MPAPAYDVIVGGAGPAGAAVAIGLTRLGYHVGVFARPRGFATCEGVSERVLQGLAEAGLRRALDVASDPVPRSVIWNGVERAANAERLVLREAFDAALLRDLQDAGIEVHASRVEAVRQLPEGGVRVGLGDGGELGARFFVEARGRAAPRGSQARVRGPETVALLQAWQGGAGAPASRVFAFRDGWAWLARPGDGVVYAQITLAAGDEAIPPREGLGFFVRERLRALPDAADWLRDALPQGEVQARASTAILQAPLGGAHSLRVGDAAMAVDPLSGNGIFQSLSGAGVAPAVINTVLREPDNAGLALGFYRERIVHLFQRFARTGRDFYRAESRRLSSPFWQERAGWPDEEPAHPARPRLLGEALRPVVERGLVRERAVLLTDEQPLGVWRVQGVEIAPLLRGLDVAAPGELGRRIAAAAAGDDVLARALRGWCARHGLDAG